MSSFAIVATTGCLLLSERPQRDDLEVASDDTATPGDESTGDATEGSTSDESSESTTWGLDSTDCAGACETQASV